MGDFMLKERIRRAFTKTVWIQKGKSEKLERIGIPPSEQIVNLIFFAIAGFIGLTALEVVNMIFSGLKQRNLLNHNRSDRRHLRICISQKAWTYLYPNKGRMLKTRGGYQNSLRKDQEDHQV
jgi:hypothetical protein